MNIHLQLVRDGALKALKTTALLAKIIVPVTLVVVALEKLNLLLPLAQYFSPVARFFSLPGEASLALLLGFFVNTFAAMGVIAALPLSVQEITVISVMLLTSHSLVTEGPILKFTGLSPLKSIMIRISVALLFGFLVNLLFEWLGG